MCFIRPLFRCASPRLAAVFPVLNIPGRGDLGKAWGLSAIAYKRQFLGALGVGILLEKLKKYGVWGWSPGFDHDYLSGAKRCVSLP